MKYVYLFWIFLLLQGLFFPGNVMATNWPKVYAPFDSIANRLELQNQLRLTDHDCEQLVDEMERMVTDDVRHRDVLWWRLQFWKAWLLRRTDKIEAVRLANQAIVKVDTVAFKYDYIYMRRFILDVNISAHEEPFEEYLEWRNIISYAESIKDTLLLANSYRGMGNHLCFLGDGSRAYSYLKQSSEFYKAIGDRTMSLGNWLNIANSYGFVGNLDSATVILKRLLLQPEMMQDSFMLANIYVNLSHYEMDSEAKIGYSYKAYDIASRLNYPSILSIASINKGSALMEINPDSALFYYNQTWQYLQECNDYNALFPTLKGLMMINDRLSRYDEAWKYARIYFNFQDSIQESEQALQISNLEQRRDIEQYEHSLTQEKELARNHTIIFVLTAALLALLAMGLGCFIYLQRKQSRLKEQNRKLELDAMNRELTVHELMLIEKNRMLEELEKRIGEGRAQGEIDHQTAVELRSQINAHVKRDNEWQNFHIQFEQVYPEFYTSLKKAAPTLTEGELRLCAFIRTGMDNKQIAAMLSQQPESVIKSRYRLRKKLPLTSGDSLEDYLRNI